MTNPLVDLTIAAAQIKGRAPEPFKDLCNAVQGLEQQTTAEMAAAESIHDVYRAQGKMKLVQALYKHLSQCTELRDGYQRREKNG